MSIKLMGQVWECQFTKAEQSVMLAMADHAKDDGTDCYPSIERVAWKTDYSTRQVQRVIKDLTARGVLILVRKGGRGHAAEYRIDLNRADPKPEFSPKKHDTMSPYTPKGDMVSPQNGTNKHDIVSSNQPKDDMVSPQPERDRTTFRPLKDDILGLKDDIAMSPQSLTIKPSEGDDISSSPAFWIDCVDELSRTLAGGFVPTLTEARCEAAGEKTDPRDGKIKPFYRVIVPAARAKGLDHFTVQAGEAIRRKVSMSLGHPVLIEIVADEIAQAMPELEPTP